MFNNVLVTGTTYNEDPCVFDYKGAIQVIRVTLE